jgi:uncharacterized protein YqjF (DUF2071 family)
MGQTWERLLFAHWTVPHDAMRRVVPQELPLDAFDDAHFVGVTPFVVTGLRPRLLPPPPAGSRFAELNVRTYVTVDGKPGIWFLSMDAASRLAVHAARRGYRLPYFPARMSARSSAGAIDYRSERTSGPPARFAATYEPQGPPQPPRPGTLEHFLTERYCLYTLDERHRVHRADIHHPPWPLQRGGARIEANTLGEPLGLDLSGAPLLHYSERQDVVIWR